MKAKEEVEVLRTQIARVRAERDWYKGVADAYEAFSLKTHSHVNLRYRDYDGRVECGGCYQTWRPVT